MIKLFGMGSPNVLKVYIALEELALPYEVSAVDVFRGKPYTCFESGAILLYLAEKTGKFLSKDMTTKYDEIQWLMTQMSTVGPMFGQLVHFVRFAPAGNDYSKSRYLTQAVRVSNVIEQRLNQHAYLGGEHYSIADMATYPWSRYLPVFLGDTAPAKFPRTLAWVDKIGARPAVKAALAKADAVH